MRNEGRGTGGVRPPRLPEANAGGIHQRIQVSSISSKWYRVTHLYRKERYGSGSSVRA